MAGSCEKSNVINVASGVCIASRREARELRIDMAAPM